MHFNPEFLTFFYENLFAPRFYKIGLFLHPRKSHTWNGRSDSTPRILIYLLLGKFVRYNAQKIPKDNFLEWNFLPKLIFLLLTTIFFPLQLDMWRNFLLEIETLLQNLHYFSLKLELKAWSHHCTDIWPTLVFQAIFWGHLCFENKLEVILSNVKQPNQPIVSGFPDLSTRFDLRKDKAWLPQEGNLFCTQFPSLRIFINKKVGNWKN